MNRKIANVRSLLVHPAFVLFCLTAVQHILLQILLTEYYCQKQQWTFGEKYFSGDAKYTDAMIHVEFENVTGISKPEWITQHFKSKKSATFLMKKTCDT